MVERFSFNPAVWEARRFQQQLAELGGCSRIIGDGSSRPNLEQVFSWSLLGYRLSDYNVDRNVLTPFECRLQTSKNYKLGAVVDYDGVMTSPAHVMWKLLRAPRGWVGGLRELKHLGKVPFERWAWLSRVSEAADRAILFTSRFSPTKGAPWWLRIVTLRGQIGCYPLLGPETMRQLEELREREKLGLRTNKPFRARDNTVLNGIVTSCDITYIVGSSHFDRTRALKLVQANPDLAPKVVFFDTCHLFL